MKRLILCCDGTWDTPDQTSNGKACQTNVTKVAAAVADTDAHGIEQLVLYHRGVGTAPHQRLLGGVFGVGLSRGVQDAYRFVVANYEPGDDLFLFGFSRGAYTARSTAGLIRNAGILRRENLDQLGPAYALYRDRAAHPRDVESRLFRRTYSHRELRIRFIGVWDTVGELGIPLSGVPLVDRLNRRLQFHDTALSSIVQAAYQALAIDECRKPFAPAIWQQQDHSTEQTAEQVWFTGVHCDVGGGYADAGLSDIALEWMVDRATSCGLEFRDGAFPMGGPAGPEAGAGPAAPDPFAPDPLGPLHDSRKGIYRLVAPAPRAICAEPTGNEYVASTAVERTSADPSYAPENLTQALNGTHKVMQV